MAGNSGAIRAGRAFVEIFADNSSLKRGLKNAQMRLRKFSGAVGGIGRKMAGFGIAAATPLAMAATVFSTFSDRMSEVRAITGATGAEFSQLENKAKELGRTTSFSASQAAEGMKFLGMAGFTTEQILAGIPGVLNLARAGAVDLAVAADIASDVGSAFGMGADEIGHLGDVLAKTATSANTSIEMMGESFKFAAPVARAAGQTLEETSAAMGILGNSAVKASMAGTDIKNLLTVMAQTPDLGFGVKAADEAGNMRPLLDVMRDLGQATEGLSQTDRLAFFMERFGKISAKSALILSSAGEQVESMREKLAAADGAAAAAAATMDDNLGGAFRMLQSAVEGAAIEIGEALAPMLRGWAAGLQSVSAWVSVAVSKNRALLAALAKGIAITVGVGAALAAVGAAAGAMASGIGVALGVLAVVKTVLLAVAGSVAFLLSPIGLVIGGLGALATWFLTSTAAGGAALDWLRAKFGELAGAAMEAIGGIGDALAAGDLQLAADILWAGLRVAWHKGTAALNAAWIDAKHFFLDVWAGATASAAGLMIDSWAGLRSAWVETVAFIQDAWTAATGGMLQAFYKLVEAAGRANIAFQEQTGQLTAGQADAARFGLGLLTSTASQQATADTTDDLTASDQQRRDQLARIEADRAGARGEIDSQAAADRAARQASATAAGGQLDAELARAQAEYRDALARTKAGQGAAGSVEAGDSEAGGSLADRLKAAVAGLNGVSADGGTKVLGSFNAAAARGFGVGSGPEEQTAENTKATAEGVKQLIKQQAKAAAAFT